MSLYSVDENGVKYRENNGYLECFLAFYPKVLKPEKIESSVTRSDEDEEQDIQQELTLDEKRIKLSEKTKTLYRKRNEKRNLTNPHTDELREKNAELESIKKDPSQADRRKSLRLEIQNIKYRKLQYEKKDLYDEKKRLESEIEALEVEINSLKDSIRNQDKILSVLELVSRSDIYIFYRKISSSQADIKFILYDRLPLNKKKSEGDKRQFLRSFFRRYMTFADKYKCQLLSDFELEFREWGKKLSFKEKIKKLFSYWTLPLNFMGIPLGLVLAYFASWPALILPGGIILYDLFNTPLLKWHSFMTKHSLSQNKAISRTISEPKGIRSQFVLKLHRTPPSLAVDDILIITSLSINKSKEFSVKRRLTYEGYLVMDHTEKEVESLVQDIKHDREEFKGQGFEVPFQFLVNKKTDKNKEVFATDADHFKIEESSFVY